MARIPDARKIAGRALEPARQELRQQEAEIVEQISTTKRNLAERERLLAEQQRAMQSQAVVRGGGLSLRAQREQIAQQIGQEATKVREAKQQVAQAEVSVAEQFQKARQELEKQKEALQKQVVKSLAFAIPEERKSLESRLQEEFKKQVGELTEEQKAEISSQVRKALGEVQPRGIRPTAPEFSITIPTKEIEAPISEVIIETPSARKSFLQRAAELTAPNLLGLSGIRATAVDIGKKVIEVSPPVITKIAKRQEKFKTTPLGIALGATFGLVEKVEEKVSSVTPVKEIRGGLSEIGQNLRETITSSAFTPTEISAQRLVEQQEQRLTKLDEQIQKVQTAPTFNEQRFIELNEARNQAIVDLERSRQIQREVRAPVLFEIREFGGGAVEVPFPTASSLLIRPIGFSREFVESIAGIPEQIDQEPTGTLASLAGQATFFSAVGGLISPKTSKVPIVEKGKVTYKLGTIKSKGFSASDAVKIGTNPDGSAVYKVNVEQKFVVVDKGGKILNRYTTKSEQIVTTSVDSKTGAIRAAIEEAVAATERAGAGRVFRDERKMTTTQDISGIEGSVTLQPGTAANILKGTGEFFIKEKEIGKLKIQKPRVAIQFLPGKPVPTIFELPAAMVRRIKPRARAEARALSNIEVRQLGTRQTQRGKISGTETSFLFRTVSDVTPELVKVRRKGKPYVRRPRGTVPEIEKFGKTKAPKEVQKPSIETLAGEKGETIGLGKVFEPSLPEPSGIIRISHKPKAPKSPELEQLETLQTETLQKAAAVSTASAVTEAAARASIKTKVPVRAKAKAKAVTSQVADILQRTRTASASAFGLKSPQALRPSQILKIQQREQDKLTEFVSPAFDTTQVTKTITREREEEKQESLLGLGLQQTQQQIQQQIQQQVTVPVTTPAIPLTPRKPPTPPTETPFKILTPPEDETRKRIGRLKRQRIKQAYDVFVKKKTKYEKVADDLPINKAIKKGATITKNTIASKFKVVLDKTAKAKGADIPTYRPDPSLFRTYKITKGRQVPLPQGPEVYEYIERRRKRLTTGGEIGEILGFQRIARQKRIKKISFI